MLEVISVEILNFLNFGEDEDEKRLVGLRQASGRRQQGWKIAAIPSPRDLRAK